MVDSIDNYPIFIPDTLPLPLCTLLNIKLYLRDLDLKIKPLWNHSYQEEKDLLGVVTCLAHWSLTYQRSQD